MTNPIGRRYPGIAQGLGNNANAQTVQVRIENDRTPTPAQREAVARVFESHMQRLDVSIVGFHQHKTKLSDGSDVRITSNSGMHLIQMWPAGGGEAAELVEDFWGIPANSASVNGTRSPPSGVWRVPNEAVEMPDDLKMKRQYTLATNPTHPGHITWSSADFKADRKEIVLSWRGPRDRYQATSGWTTTSGGSQIPHNEFGTTIGSHVFSDSAYLWINGRKVLTPVGKIIAAAIHCPDPVGAPGMCVLRLCTDNISNDGTTLKVGCKDLVPTGETAPVSLGQLMTATSYTVINTYTAANNGTAVGQWELMQRPHFDYNGERLACTVRDHRADAFSVDGWISAVSLDAETFAILEQFDFTSTQMAVGSRSISDTTSGTVRTIVLDETDTRDTTDLFPLGVDFLGTNLVRCWLERRAMTGYVGSETRVRDDQTGSGGGILVTEGHDYSWPFEYEVTVHHSAHGALLNDEQLRHHATSYDITPSDSGVAVHPGLASPAFNVVSFVGNLARDVFALGYAVGDGLVIDPVTGPPASDGSTNNIYAGGGSQDTTVRPMVYDLWHTGVKEATGQTGSFPSDAVTTGSSIAAAPLVSHNLIDSYLTGSLNPAPTSGTVVTPNPSAYLSGFSGGAPSPVWQQMACNAERTVAYLAINHTSSGGGSVPAMKYGLEIACFKWPDLGFSLDTTVPNYSQAGTVFTLSAPVFPGVTRKELAA